MLHVGHDALGDAHGDRVVPAHLGALAAEHVGDLDARGIAHVVGVGLEGQAQQADALAVAACPSSSRSLCTIEAALVAVDLHDGPQQRRVRAVQQPMYSSALTSLGKHEPP